MAIVPDRAQLQQTYSSTQDAELLRLAADSGSLTEDGRWALAAELDRRGLGQTLTNPAENSAQLSAPGTNGERWRRFQWLWPVIVDVRSAKRAAMMGFYSCALIAGASVIVAVLYSFGVKLDGFDMGILVDGGFFILAGWRTYHMSRTWAALGLIGFIIEMLYKVLTAGPKGIGVISAILLIGFVNGVRGTEAYHELSVRTPVV